MNKKVIKALPAVSCGFFVLLIYLHYLAPDIVSGDGADLIGQSYLLGVCHQTGYPITVMAGKLFTLLPFGTIPLRVNLLSAVSAAVAVSFVVLTLSALLQSAGAALVGGIVLGLSPLFWSKAEAANVHIFSAMLISMYILLFILFLVQGNYLFFLFGMFLFGLSWTAHMQNLLSVPAIGWIIVVKRKELPWRILVYGFCLFILGLMPYLWMMQRASVAPPFSTYQPPTTPMRLITYVLGLKFQPWQVSSSGTLLGGLLRVGRIYVGCYLLVGILLMMVGLLRLWRINRNAWLFFALIFAANTLFFANLSHYYFSLSNRIIPGAMIMAIWISAGTKEIHEFISHRSPKGARLIFPGLFGAWVIAALLLFPSVDFLQWFKKTTGVPIPTVDWRRVYEARDFVTEMKARLPQDSVIVTQWTYFALLKYAQEVEGIRPDLQLVLHSETKDALDRIRSDRVAMEALHSSRPILYVDARGIVPLTASTVMTDRSLMAGSD
jgi:hypothetical protein